jgi:predicted nucleotidyltransferase
MPAAMALGSGRRVMLELWSRAIRGHQAMVSPAISIPKQAVAEFCRRHGICRLSLFGSVLRDDFRPDSDVDVLVEFKPGKVIGWEIIDIEDELSRLLDGHKIDMVNPKYLNRHLKDRILDSAVVQYEEG